MQHVMPRAHSREGIILIAHIRHAQTRTSGIVADREALAAGHKVRMLRVHALQLADKLLVGALLSPDGKENAKKISCDEIAWRNGEKIIPEIKTK